MCLDLGYIGLALLIYMIMIAFLRAIRLYRISGNRAAAFPLVCIVSVICLNFTESDLFRTHSFLWCPFVAIYASLKLLENERADIASATAAWLPNSRLKVAPIISRCGVAVGSVNRD
jgi:O-antigen ligase